MKVIPVWLFVVIMFLISFVAHCLEVDVEISAAGNQEQPLYSVNSCGVTYSNLTFVSKGGSIHTYEKDGKVREFVGVFSVIEQ